MLRANAANAPTFCLGHASFRCKYLVSCEIVSFIEVRRKGLARCGSRLSLARLALHPCKQSNIVPAEKRKRCFCKRHVNPCKAGHAYLSRICTSSFVFSSSLCGAGLMPFFSSFAAFFRIAGVDWVRPTSSRSSADVGT